MRWRSARHANRRLPRRLRRRRSAKPAAPNPGHSVTGHLLLVSWPDGYRLLEREGAPPARRDRLDVDGVEFSVLRLGPSPLPGDWRRCAYLEREEPSTVDRTFDR